MGISEDAPVVGIIANLRPVKRIDRFIEVASMIKNKNCHFIIVGWAKDRKVLLREIDRRGLNDRMHFVYSVDNVYQYLKLFDIGVLTSASEGLSNSLIEYSLSGSPSVAFDVGGNSEIIEDGETGYIIKDGDKESMATKIDLLIENKKQARQLGEKAIQFSRAAFSIEKMVSKTESFYETILGSNR